MNDVVPAGNPLDRAASELRELFELRDRFAPPLDTAALGRMIAHIQNINRSVSESTEDHVNAAKRLTDFSLVLDRIARKAPSGSEDVATRLHDIAETLKATGTQLAERAAPPDWAAGPR